MEFIQRFENPIRPYADEEAEKIAEAEVANPKLRIERLRMIVGLPETATVAEIELAMAAHMGKQFRLSLGLPEEATAAEVEAATAGS